MYTLDKTAFLTAMEQRGWNSLSAFAKAYDLHRNTLHGYLSGKPVLPEKLQIMLDAVRLKPAQAFIESASELQKLPASIAAIIDELHQKFPLITLVLFGSRARKSAQRYSDFDIGVFSRSGIEHKTFRQLQLTKDDLEEESPYIVDLVNLNRAPEDFLRNASIDWIFLTGSQQDWLELQDRAPNDSVRT